MILTALLRLFGWGVIILASLLFLVFTVLPLLDTSDSMTFEIGTFGLALGRFVGLAGIGGVLPLWIANRRRTT